MASKESDNPPENPPSYIEATSTGTSTGSRPVQSTHLEVPDHNGIPAAHRRSMEDELRPLPEGWIRQFDNKEMHQYFVDTKADPPRSIWTHPYDDEQYLSTLTSEERERIQAEEAAMRRPLTPAPVGEKKQPDSKTQSPAEHFPPDLPVRPGQSTQDVRKKSFGEKLKDKVTGTTREERERDRARRAEEERRYYEAHLKFRQALRQSQITGQPQPLGKDNEGHDIFLLPPQGPGYGYGGYSGYDGRYIQPSPIYNNPNARFVPPPGASYGYGRPGYGGVGLGLPLLGGLAGGALLGGLLF